MGEQEQNKTQLDERQTAARPGADLVSSDLMLTSSQSDCCSARPAYRAVVPTPGNPTRPAELLFCGHHLRTSLDALRRASAEVFDVVGQPVHSVN